MHLCILNSIGVPRVPSALRKNKKIWKSTPFKTEFKKLLWNRPSKVRLRKFHFLIRIYLKCDRCDTLVTPLTLRSSKLLQRLYLIIFQTWFCIKEPKNISIEVAVKLSKLIIFQFFKHRCSVSTGLRMSTFDRKFL